MRKLRTDYLDLLLIHQPFGDYYGTYRAMERMQQNFDLFDFTLSAEDMAAIEALDSGESLFFSHYDPKTVEWFMTIV